MTTTKFLLILFTIAASILCLSWRFVSRVMAAFTLLLIYYQLTTPPVHRSDQGVFYEIFLLSLGILIAVIYLAFFVRYALEQRPVRRSARNPPGSLVQICDVVLFALMAGVLAACCFVNAGWLVQGSDRPVLWHGLFGAICLVITLFAFRPRPITIRLAMLVFALVTIGLLIWSYFWHPGLVLRAGDVASEGRPHCIFLETRKRVVSDQSDLTFLTFDKNRGSPHATLVIQRAGKPLYLYWSYHGVRFDKVYWQSDVTCKTFGQS